MDRATALARLRENAAEIQSDGVTRLRLFGSTARNQAKRNSDVDLLADFSPEMNLDLLSLASLQLKLSRMLRSKVDLTSEPWLRDYVRPSALAEAVLVF